MVVSRHTGHPVSDSPRPRQQIEISERTAT